MTPPRPPAIIPSMANYEGDAIVVDDLRVVRGGREVLPGLSVSVPTGVLVLWGLL